MPLTIRYYCCIVACDKADRKHKSTHSSTSYVSAFEFSGSLCLPRHPKHILNKNPIPTLRLVDHDVRDGTDEFSVLQNRRPRHVRCSLGTTIYSISILMYLLPKISFQSRSFDHLDLQYGFHYHQPFPQDHQFCPRDHQFYP